MERKIRIGAVSYLNTKPLIYGIENSDFLNQVDLTSDYPSKIAAKLLNDEVDVGLVPVAIIPKLKEAHIVSDYCIGTEGEVASVGIYSECKLEEAEKLLLDYQSWTSVALSRLLLKQHWKLNPEQEYGGTDYRSRIQGRTAGVVIGDRALEQGNISRYCYDLGLAWRDYTGLPFVFAAWVSNKVLDDSFVVAFNEANAVGMNHFAEIVKQNPFPHYDLMKYYSENMSYKLDEKKKEGLNLFLREIQEFGLLPQ
ncbi:MAG TPA: menaquinone biosynthesis protein [Parasegetibacter sp.]